MSPQKYKGKRKKKNARLTDKEENKTGTEMGKGDNYEYGPTSERAGRERWSAVVVI